MTQLHAIMAVPLATSSADEIEDHAADVIPELAEAADGVVTLTLTAAHQAGVLRVWLPFTCGRVAPDIRLEFS